MKARTFHLLALISLSALLVSAQQSRIAGPVSGYLFDGSAHGLRPILGIPGASLIGDPIRFGFDLASASVAPRQDSTFVAAGDGTFHLFRIDGGAVSEVTVAGLSAVPDRVVFSPAGTAAALYTGGSVAIVTGLPASPSITGTLDVSALGTPDSLALSDDGAILLAAAGTSVELYGNFNDFGKLTDVAGPAMVAFAPGGHDAAIGDLAGAGIVLYHDLTGSGDSSILAAPDDTLTGSTGLTFSTDGKGLLLANSPAQSVIAFDLAAGNRSSIPCSCSPTGIARMGNLFRLNELGRDPVWLLDSQAAQPRTLFVPALAAASE